MDISTLRKDTDSATDGIWIPFGEDSKVKIAQWLNKDHAAYLRDVSKKYGRRIEQRAITNEELTPIMAKQWAFIIRDLTGFTENGEPVEWSEELIIRWACDEQLNDFFVDCETLSKDKLNYRKETIEELGKLLASSQDGGSDGEKKKKTSKKSQSKEE